MEFSASVGRIYKEPIAVVLCTV